MLCWLTLVSSNGFVVWQNAPDPQKACKCLRTAQIIIQAKSWVLKEKNAKVVEARLIITNNLENRHIRSFSLCVYFTFSLCELLQRIGGSWRCCSAGISEFVSEWLGMIETQTIGDESLSTKSKTRWSSRRIRPLAVGDERLQFSWWSTTTM